LQSIRPIALYNNETGYFDLHLKVKPEKKVRINIGGNISTKPINQGYASFDYRSYQNRAYSLSSNIYFGRFYSSFKAGGRIDFPTTLPFYLAGYSTFNRWDFFSSSSELFFEDVRPPYIIQDEYNLRFEAGIPVGQHAKLYTDYSLVNSSDEYYQTEIFKKEDEPDNTGFTAFVSQLALESNSLNYKQFASEGSFNSVSLKHVIGKETNEPGTTANIPGKIKSNHNYFLAQASTLKYWRMGSRFSLGTQLEAVISNKKMFQNYRSTLLSAPGYYPTPHSNSLFIENFHSNNYVAGGLKAIFNLNPTFNLRIEGHGFIPIKEERLNPDMTVGRNPKLIENYYLQGMAALVHHTALGPISIALNYYEKPNTNLYFTLNFGYILFNKRGL
jgi:NTE family protein